MIEYYYDTFGRSTGYAINGVRQTTIDYDSFGRISTMTVPATENGENVHSPTPTQSSNSFHWTYLQGSDLKASLAYPNGLTASWTYDANNQLLQVKNTYPSDGLGRDGSPLPSAGVISQFDYTYDAAGRRTAITRSGSAFGDLSGSVDTYTYNARSELTSARRTKNGQPIPGFSEDFDYDPIGNRRSSATYNEKGEAQTSTYQANNLNQYTTRTTPGYAAVRGEADPNATVTVNENPAFRLGSYYFGSDLFDNSSSGGLATLQTYATLAQAAANGDETDDLISSTTNQVYLAQSPETFAYDDDGNQTLVTTRTGRWRVEYNGENRPVLWENVSTNSPTPNSTTPSLISMSYDHMGRRREKNTQRFFYDGYLQIANFHSPTPTQSSNCYIWDCTEPVATRPLAWSRGNSSDYYVHDGNKNVCEVIASNSSIAAHYEYAPFGAVTTQCGESAAANPWRFSSEYAEDDTATVYYNYRHYEPIMGRWLSRDSMGEIGGANLISFVANSVMSQSDYIGLNFIDSTREFMNALWSVMEHLAAGATMGICVRNWFVDNKDRYECCPKGVQEPVGLDKYDGVINGTESSWTIAHRITGCQLKAIGLSEEEVALLNGFHEAYEFFRPWHPEALAFMDEFNDFNSLVNQMGSSIWQYLNDTVSDIEAVMEGFNSDGENCYEKYIPHECKLKTSK